MNMLHIRKIEECQYDIVSLGEVMLRLDPGEGRIRTARHFRAWEGGGEHIFGTLGVRWFHTGGIFAALSETTGEVVIEAARAAKKHGPMVSYDLNYRPSLAEVEKIVAGAGARVDR